MANVGFDGRTLFDENKQEVPLRSKQISNENRLVKKQVFGDLKNSMQNQQNCLTPLKGNEAKIDGLPTQFCASPSLRHDVLRKQQLKRNFLELQHQLEFGSKTDAVEKQYQGPVFDEELFDSWDYDRKCCRRQKSEEELWAETSVEHFERILKNVSVTDEDDDKPTIEIPKMFDDFDDDFFVPNNYTLFEPEEPTMCQMLLPLDFADY